MLNTEQQLQIHRQIEAYEREGKKGSLRVAVPLRSRSFLLEVKPFVANPTIMNSGLQVVEFLAARPELVKGKAVTDMGTGSGIIGIAAALLGASFVLMPDKDRQAVSCAEKNIKINGLVGCCLAFWSDLFSSLQDLQAADVQIFNHPFFAAEPIPDKPWTAMMLGGTELLGSYFEQAPLCSHRETIYILPWLVTASNDEELDNDPGKRAGQYGYEVLERVEMSPVGQGIQQRPFVIYVLRHNG